MDLTYDYISKWFDDYFEDVRRYQGNLETVPNLKKYASSAEFVGAFRLW